MPTKNCPQRKKWKPGQGQAPKGYYWDGKQWIPERKDDETQNKKSTS